MAVDKITTPEQHLASTTSPADSFNAPALLNDLQSFVKNSVDAGRDFFGRTDSASQHLTPADQLLGNGGSDAPATSAPKDAPNAPGSVPKRPDQGFSVRPAEQLTPRGDGVGSDNAHVPHPSGDLQIKNPEPKIDAEPVVGDHKLGGSIHGRKENESTP